MAVGGVSHYVVGETCALTCLTGYTYYNVRRTEKLCLCKNGACNWKFESRAKCVPDESVLRHFNILESFNSLGSSAEQISFVESRLGGKEAEILEFQRSNGKTRPMGNRKPALGGMRGKKEKQKSTGQRMQRRRPSAKISTRSFMQVNIPVNSNNLFFSNFNY